MLPPGALMRTTRDVAKEARPPASKASKELVWDVLDDGTQVSGLFSEWEELHRTSGTPNPFCHPAWITTWFDYFTRPEDVFVVTAREMGRLVAVAPFHRRVPKVTAPFPGRCLR